MQSHVGPKYDMSESDMITFRKSHFVHGHVIPIVFLQKKIGAARLLELVLRRFGAPPLGEILDP